MKDLRSLLCLVDEQSRFSEDPEGDKRGVAADVAVRWSRLVCRWSRGEKKRGGFVRGLSALMAYGGADLVVRRLKMKETGEGFTVVSGLAATAAAHCSTICPLDEQHTFGLFLGPVEVPGSVVIGKVGIDLDEMSMLIKLEYILEQFFLIAQIENGESIITFWSWDKCAMMFYYEYRFASIFEK
ncbi:hypothetical protein HAX54_034428 [Datura stramonium]|uniref:Uncharacterized protein n=1 Tax=Datura stramonium TaxID=4076 RepID=A0ABS8VF11_DATST|nr:hypothetical protein [Datura stramonium]